MDRKHLLVTPAAALALVVAACGGGSTASSGGGSQAEVVAASSKLGKILTDGKGLTLYIYTADKTTASNCYTSCAQLWPPFVVGGSAHAGSGADASKLGTTRRTDGTTQVTYGGHPLYYYAGDKQAGQTAGEAIKDSGGEWYAVSPGGAAVDNS